ncbi:DUF3667 domain-containing protein [Robiginitalea sp. IMCC44478]|uniref:DUF3667 domain-containing protein n=1 Tax=Robiginitalea sp. IMCC44478 TaxID=3459122 RepID=UPI004041CBF0
MQCKNCNTTLRTDFAFCPGCGGKIVLKRITFKGLTSDFYDHYFDLDNTFIRTFLDLFTKPQQVLWAYVEGVRRKYVNPMSYLAISFALSGILFFVMKKQIDKLQMDLFSGQMDSEAGRKILDVTMEYSSLIMILYIPIMALAGYLVFNKKDFNLPEYTTAATYVLAQYSIFTFPISLILLLLSPESYMNYSLFGILILVVYTGFAFARFNGGKLRQQLLRFFIYGIIFVIGYFGLSLVLNIIFFLTGVLEIKDFLPKQ